MVGACHEGPFLQRPAAVLWHRHHPRSERDPPLVIEEEWQGRKEQRRIRGLEPLQPAFRGLLVDGLDGQVRGGPESAGECVHRRLRFPRGSRISRCADDERDGDEQHGQPLRSAKATREPRRIAWIG